MQQAELRLNLSIKRTRTRKREFPARMRHVVPWAKLEALIARHASEGRRGTIPLSVRTMLRIPCTQQ